MSYIAKNGRLYTSGASEALTLLDDKFSVNKSYSKGDSCIYNDYLWKFTSDKPAGEWDNSVVEQCRIMDFVDDVNGHLTQTEAKVNDVNGRLTQVQTQIVPTASIESGETASKAYSVGEYLVKNGVLYKVTNAIAEGDTLTIGTNIAITTVGGELSSISEHLSDDIDRVTQDGVVLTSPYTCTRKRECIRVEVGCGYTEKKDSRGQIFVNGHLAVQADQNYGNWFSVQTLIYLYEGDVLTFAKIGSGQANAWRVSDD